MEISLFQSTALYILCNSELVLVQQILLPLFSYQNFARLALTTIKICRQPAMCLVPALASSHVMHLTVRLAWVTHLWIKWGKKGRWLCPETEIKAGDYLKFNILISYYLKNQELPFIIYEEHSGKPVKSF